MGRPNSPVTSIAEVNIAADSGIAVTDADSGVFERQGNPSTNCRSLRAEAELVKVLGAALFGPNEAGCRLEIQSIWVNYSISSLSR